MPARASTEPNEPTQAAARPGGRRWIAAGAGVVVIAVGVGFWRSRASSHAGAAPASSAEARIVPVSTASVEKRDVPVYLEGLGNALPLATGTANSPAHAPPHTVVFPEGPDLHNSD